MPFKSEKQRRYLHAKEPAVAKRWEKKYGSDPRKPKDPDDTSPNTYREHGKGGKLRGGPGGAHTRIAKESGATSAAVLEAAKRYLLKEQKKGKTR